MASSTTHEGLVDSDEEDAPLVLRPRKKISASSAPEARPATEDPEEAAAPSEARSLTLQEQVQRLQDRVDDLRAELQVERLASDQKDTIVAALRAENARLVRYEPLPSQ